MRIYKPGDKVRVVASTHYLTRDTRAMIGKVFEIKRYDDINNTYAVYTPDRSTWYWFGPSDLAPATPSWDNLSEGDVLVKASARYDRVIQGVIGKIVFTIDTDGDVDHHSIDQLQEVGWKIKDAESEDITEVTLEQVAEKLGISVEKLRIKD